jgi:multidrug efflux pump subunit AcrA (membrane-fusion protein)
VVKRRRLFPVGGSCRAATLPIIERLSASGLALLAMVMAAGCSGTSSSNASAAEKPDARDVQLATVTEARLDRTIVVSGDLAAEEQAVLSMKVPGRLESLSVDLGSSVTAGQTIARLESTDYRLRVAQAEAAFRQARARLGLGIEGSDEVQPQQVGVVRQAKAIMDEAHLTLGRVRTFVERGLAPRAELDSAEAAFTVAESRYQDALEEVRSRQALLSQRRSELELAKEQLSASVLSAPFAGRILDRPAAPGQYVAAGTPIATLVRVHPLRLRVEVPERSASSVRLRQPVRVGVEGEEGTFTGVVSRLSPAISSENRTLLVEAEIPNDPPRLRPGSFARAEIVVEAGAPALVIPYGCVVSFAGVDKVFIVEEGKAVERRVRLGQRQGEFVEIQEGLARGSAVIAQPGTLVAGEAVRVEGR